MTTSRHVGPASATDTLRVQAYSAIECGLYDEAFARLESAFIADPRDHELLCDLAALALMQHEYQAAIDFARHALVFQRGHAASQFVLATAWGLFGAREQAVALFEALQVGIATPTPPDEMHELGDSIAAQLTRLRARTDHPALA